MRTIVGSGPWPVRCLVVLTVRSESQLCDVSCWDTSWNEQMSQARSWDALTLGDGRPGAGLIFWPLCVFPLVVHTVRSESQLCDV